MISKQFRCLGVFVSLSLMMTSMAGCSNKNKEEAVPTSSSKPVELTVEVFDRGVQGNAPVDNNYLTKWVNEEFGKKNNITVKYVPVLRADESTKIGILMASDAAPDICTTNVSSIVQNFVNQGGIAELDTYIDKYGPNIRSYIGETALNYGIMNGKQFYIPGKRIFRGIVSSNIRKDWLDKLGLPIPTTTDELYKTLKQFKEKDPGKVGNKLIPFDMSAQNMQMGDYSLIDSFKEKMTEEQLATTPLLSQPGVKEGYRFINKLYNEGLINKEFALDKDSKKFQANIANGYSGFYMANVGDTYAVSPEVVSTLIKNIPTAEMAPLDPFSNAEGKHPKMISSPTGLSNFIPASSKHIVEAVKYLNWQCDPKVLMTLQNGIEGTQYELKDGLPSPKTGDFEKVSNGDYCLVVNGREMGNYDKTLKAQSLQFVGFEDLYMKATKFATTDGVPGVYMEPNSVAAKYKGIQDGKSLDIKIKAITASPKDFDKVYDSLVNDYMTNSGGNETMAEAVKIYQRMYGKK